MLFLISWVKPSSTKSKDVAKKAKDFADVAKLNSQISSEQEGINAPTWPLEELAMSKTAARRERLMTLNFRRLMRPWAGLPSCKKRFR